jgi:type II secretory pathway pseudopilin PulG
MSLVEATVVLAVLALLGSVLAPSIVAYIDDARHARVRRDVATLATAISRMLVDTGESFVLRDGNGASSTAPPLHGSSNRVHLLVSDGNTPALDAAVDRAPGNTDWTDAIDNAAVWSFYDQLVVNTAGYRTAAEMSVAAEFDPDSGSGSNSEFFWRGAYLPPPVGPDPWGNRYAANVEFLGRISGSSASGSDNDVLVLSAGPNATVDTTFAASPTAFSSAPDDVFLVVVGGSR